MQKREKREFRPVIFLIFVPSDTDANVWLRKPKVAWIVKIRKVSVNFSVWSPSFYLLIRLLVTCLFKPEKVFKGREKKAEIWSVEIARHSDCDVSLRHWNFLKIMAAINGNYHKICTLHGTNFVGIKSPVDDKIDGVSPTFSNLPMRAVR